MAIVNGYATLDEFRDWVPVLDDSQDDLNLERVITAVSRGIDHYTQRHFWQATATARRFESPCDMRLLQLGAFNDLVSLTTLRTDEDGDGTFEVTWAASDFELLPLNPAAAPETRPYSEVRAVGNRWFPYVPDVPWLTSRLARIEITGTWGWPTIPEDIKQACLIRTHAVFQRRETPQGLAGTGEFGMIRISRFADPDVAAMLDPYRLTAVLIA